MAELTVQALTRAIKMYGPNVNQRGFDEHAERPTFSINTARDRIRGDKPFYLVRGWKPRSTWKQPCRYGVLNCKIDIHADGDTVYSVKINI